MSQKTAPFPDQIQAIVTHIRSGSGDVPAVLIGPVVTSPDGSEPQAYFIACSGASIGGNVRLDRIGSPERDLAATIRAATLAALAATPRILIFDLDDELEMARLCVSFWPSERTRRILANLKAERNSPCGSS